MICAFSGKHCTKKNSTKLEEIRGMGREKKRDGKFYPKTEKVTVFVRDEYLPRYRAFKRGQMVMTGNLAE